MTLPATDTFTNSSGSDLGLTAYSANWSYVRGVHAVGQLADFVSNSGGGKAVARWNADTFSADHYSQGVLAGALGGGFYIGLSVRCSSSAETAYAYITDGSAGYLTRIAAGVLTDLSSPDAQAWAIGDVMRLEASGTGATVTITIKRALAASPTSFSTVRTFGDTDASRIVGPGYAGVASQVDSTFALGIDNWEGGNLASAGGASTARFRSLLFPS